MFFFLSILFYVVINPFIGKTAITLKKVSHLFKLHSILGDSPRHSDSPDTGGSAGSGRPVREAVINAAAITEAQNDIYNNIGKRYNYNISFTYL